MSQSALADLLARKTLLIFDFDGTLVDSSPLHARAFQSVFEPFGVEVDYGSIAGMTTGTAVDTLARKFGLSLDEDARENLVAQKRVLGRELMARELAAIEGASEFVEAATAGFRLALCTSGSRDTVSHALDLVGLAGRFERVVTAEDVVRGKPDPEGFVKILDGYDVPASAALVFEDAESGLAAARAAGIDVIRLVPAGTASRPGEADWAMLIAALEAVR